MLARLAFCVSLVGSTTFAATIHVDGANPNCPGNGSVGNPFCTIQAAIAAAATGDVISVAPGAYAGTVDFLGKAIRVEAALGTAFTTIDGNGSVSCVRFANGEGPQSVLKGFTIKHGLGPAVPYFPSPSRAGGGIFCDGTSPTIEGNAIVVNAADYGGGLFCTGGAPIVRNNEFVDNIAGQGAGILCRDHASPLIENNEIHGGDAWMGGVGIMLLDCDNPRVVANIIGPNGTVFMGGFNSGVGAGVFAEGTTDFESRGNIYLNNLGAYGGAVELESSNASFEDDTFQGNSSEWDGGAIAAWGSPAIVRRCVFSSNGCAYGFGGAIYGIGNPALATIQVEDSTFEVNASGGFGQALFFDSGCPGEVARCSFMDQGPWSNFGGAVDGSESALIEDSVFARNAMGIRSNGAWTVRRFTFTGTPGSVLEAMSGTIALENSIVWGNPSGAFAIDTFAPGTYVVTDSVVEGGFPGTNVLNADPLFVDPLLDDYRLALGSPCIDAGDVNAAPCGFDLGGSPRFNSGLLTTFARVDMGAHEFSHVRLTAGPGLPGTKLITSDGTNGLPTMLFAGFAPGSVCAYPAGTIGIDLAQAWLLLPWVPVGASVNLTVPAVPGLPPSAFLQLLALGPQPYTANLSNVVELPLP